MKSLTYFNGEWKDGMAPTLNALNGAFMYALSVFDGARSFRSLVPDLDLHCERVLTSAKTLGLSSPIQMKEILKLSIEGIQKFDPKAELYIRPVIFDNVLSPLPISGVGTFMLSIFEMPMPDPSKGAAITISPFRRPDPRTAPTTIKCTSLYVTSMMAAREAVSRGFQGAVFCDLKGNVLELATANLWIVKDGKIITPQSSDNYLSGITRLRVLSLLKKENIPVEERVVSIADLEQADEIFSTGNAGKVTFVTKFENKALAIGPVAKKVRDLYMAYAETQSVDAYLKQKL